MTVTGVSCPVDVETTHRPRDLAGAREAVLAARECDANILVHGAGTKLGWAGKPDAGRGWHAIDTRDLQGMLRHDAADMTAAVQAGMPLGELQTELARAGQEFGVDPPGRSAGATVGGVFVAGDAGPRRQRYGGVRDHVIGTTAVLADGTVARSGGDVIKNVAGYDLGKLWSGSMGTLGLVVELTVRLHPLPEASRMVRVPVSAPVATEIVLDLLAGPVECSAMEWSSDDDGVLLLGVEGRAGGLAAQVDAVAAAARRRGARCVDAVDSVGPADGAPSQWDTWRDAHCASTGSTRARAATRPADLAVTAEALTAAARGTPVEVALRSHAGQGLHDAVVTGGAASDHAAVVASWRERVRALGGSVVLRERRAGVDEHVDVWGGLEPKRRLALMRSVKDALDPEHRFAPGRFVGGI